MKHSKKIRNRKSAVYGNLVLDETDGDNTESVPPASDNSLKSYQYWERALKGKEYNPTRNLTCYSTSSNPKLRNHDVIVM